MLVKNDKTDKVRHGNCEPRIFNVKQTSDVFHGYIDEGLSKERSRELLQRVEPYIYGATPLYQAIRTATECFEKNASTFGSHRNLLFVLSDGDPSDGKTGDSTTIKEAAKSLKKW